MALLAWPFYFALNRHKFYNDTLTTRYRRGKNCRREHHKTSFNGVGIGTAIGNVERNSTFSPYSYILS